MGKRWSASCSGTEAGKEEGSLRISCHTRALTGTLLCKLQLNQNKANPNVDWYRDPAQGLAGLPQEKHDRLTVCHLVTAPQTRAWKIAFQAFLPNCTLVLFSREEVLDQIQRHLG